MKEYGVKIDIYDKFFFKDESYKQNRYDIIISTEVFEHLENPLNEIESLLSILDRDGLLIIMTNFHDSNIEKFKKWWYVRDLTHVVFYTLETFEYLAKQFKLEIIKCDNKKNIILRKL